MLEFKEFKSIGRMSKNCVITEKINGTNAQICIIKATKDYQYEDFTGITYNISKDLCMFIPKDELEQYCLGQKDDFYMFAGSRNRWLKIGDDNFGFASWVKANTEELFKLGEGTHYGEWAGKGIQRGYGLTEKRFYLFNTSRWADYHNPPKQTEDDKTIYAPQCCYVVPVLYEGIFTTDAVEIVMTQLKEHGSYIVPFMNPEGVVVYHIATKTLFKKTFDDNHKGVKANG